MNVNRLEKYWSRMAKEPSAARQVADRASEKSDLLIDQRAKFVERLPEAIERTGISQEAIAPRIGKRPSAISRWKKVGLPKPKLPNISLQALANLAGVEYDSLWEEELREAISQDFMSISPGIPSVDDKYEALKRSSKWPMLAQLIDTIYAAEKSTSSAT